MSHSASTTHGEPAALRSLLVVPWHEPIVGRLGFDPRDEYVERFWLPLLGPTSTWLLRRLADEFDRQPDGFSLDAVSCARSIGVGSRGGRGNPFRKAVDRCIRYGLFREEEHDILGVRTRIPALTRAQTGQLPAHLRAPHRRWMSQRRRVGDPITDDTHATRLARSLLDVGASTDEVEAQLQRWRFDLDATRRALALAREPG